MTLQSTLVVELSQNGQSGYAEASNNMYCDRTVSMYEAAGRAVAKMR